MGFSKQDIINSIRTVPDFPKPGIMFKDITTALKNPGMLNYMADLLTEQYQGKGITKVVAVESRGFIMGSVLASRLNAGFVPVRKPGKLPADVFSHSYELEYGTDTLEIHKDALVPSDIVMIHDDLLATGGTAIAAVELVKKIGVNAKFVSFICELSFLSGRGRFSPENEVFSLISF